MTKPKLKNNETDSYPLRKRAWVVQIEKCLRAEQNNYSEDVNIISLLDCSNIPEKTNKDGSRIEIINNIQTWSNWKSIFKKKHLNKEIIPYPSSERLNNYFGNETLFWIQSYSKHLELITGNNFYNFDSKKHEHPVIKNRFYNLFSAIDLYDIQNFYTEIVSAKVSQEILISINENWAPRVYKKDSPGLTLLMPDIHKKTTTGFKINEKYEKFQQNKFNLDRPLNMPGPPISEQTSKLHDCFDYYKIPIYLLALYNEDSVKQNDALKKQLSIDFLTTCICINYIDSSNSLNQKLYSEVLKLTRELQQSLLFPISRNKHIFNFIKSIVFDIFSDFGISQKEINKYFKLLRDSDKKEIFHYEVEYDTPFKHPECWRERFSFATYSETKLLFPNIWIPKNKNGNIVYTQTSTIITDDTEPKKVSTEIYYLNEKIEKMQFNFD